MRSYSTAHLEAYLDEALPVPEMADVEMSLRENPQLTQQLADVHARRDAGVHSLGEIWRRHRLTCPTRQQLGSYLLGVLPPSLADYIAFHLQQVHCRHCLANLTDLENRQRESATEVATRRGKFFRSSAGYLSGG
ncbi:MAG: hypothetical protein GTO62_06580 [Planctomycetales bacterium]|nr:hypothetical protein [Planctomycetales bacterium]NIP85025.1 hypothetical protein [Planctomycetales bacterium]